MLFRDNKGKLVTIERNQFHNDKDYYEKICSIYNIKFAKQQNQLDNILNFINNPKNSSYKNTKLR